MSLSPEMAAPTKPLARDDRAVRIRSMIRANEEAARRRSPTAPCTAGVPSWLNAPSEFGRDVGSAECLV